MAYPLTVCVGDTHFPFHSRLTVERIVDAVASLRPKIVVQEGDLFDMYSWSRFPRSENIMTPLQEAKAGRKYAEMFWARIRKAAPKAKLFQIKGNHDARPYLRVQESLPEMEGFLGLDQLWTFDGVETMGDAREELIIRGVVHMHGFRPFGKHVEHNRMNTVTGHLHRGGVHFYRLGAKTLWELNSGFCANPLSRPMSYAQQRRFSQQTQGFGLIDRSGWPMFCPLPNPG